MSTLKAFLTRTVICSGAAILSAGTARAQCVFQAPVGDDAYSCSSGISAGGLLDTGGNNQLVFPIGGSGTLAGDVIFGAGIDRIVMNSGVITGAVDQGDGADAFLISTGAVSGSVFQGEGIDDFRIVGGTIQSLNQGNGFDTFFMSGGRIIDFFDDGDYAIMTGGRIGRVNLKLADNVFDMSGGTIDRNIVAGFGNDTVFISGGTIGGNISVSGGDDIVTVTGGSIAGDILTSFGNDAFTWAGGGIVFGNILLGPGADTALLADLTTANLGQLDVLAGGGDVDVLTLSNVTTNGVARFQEFETVELTNDSEIVFDGTLVLGDAGTQSGVVSVDASSTIYGGGGIFSIRPYSLGVFAGLTNEGRIDLTNGGATPGDRFAVNGNYVGNGGLLFTDTVLGADSSASDRLVVSGGAISGTTGLTVLNRGGTGAETVTDGIMVVEATNGATSAPGAFALTGRVAAGAFEYFLFRGGTSVGSDENWYLRSTIAAGPEPAPAPPIGPIPSQPEPLAPEPAPPPPLQPTEPPAPLPVDPNDPDPQDFSPPVDIGDPAPEATPEPEPAPGPTPPPPPPTLQVNAAPVPGPGSNPPTPGATRVPGNVVPLYRVEVATYSALMPAARELALTALGTFHERRGDQRSQTEPGAWSTSWLRVYGQDFERDWKGTVSPGLDGHLAGVQLGQDLFGWQSGFGTSFVGFFGGYSRIEGDIAGQALGWNGVATGDLNIDAYHLGGSYTYLADQGWYIDGVLMGSWFDGEAAASSGIGIDLNGNAISASLEAGYPITLTEEWSLEPQAQLVWQHLSFDDREDAFARIQLSADEGVTARFGFRLSGEFGHTVRYRPYLKASIWHSFNADQTVQFNENAIVTTVDGTALEFGGGLVLDVNDTVSLYAHADYTTDIDGGHQHVIEGNLGVALRW